MLYRYFVHTPRESSAAECTHASQGLDTGALCGWYYLDGADPALTEAPQALHTLLASVSCSACVRHILACETYRR
jgi:hypothetical protein